VKYSEKKILRILERDKWHCRYCGALVDRRTAVLDHIIPKSKGGSKSSDSNLGTSCRRCNALKWDFPIETFLQRIEQRQAESLELYEYCSRVIETTRLLV
jgi:5-methylcytosine-specific restriction endonuclease McrA